jgi:hypothetical protein
VWYFRGVFFERKFEGAKFVSVTYSKQQRAVAKQDGLKLVTMSVPGVEFQGPVTKEEAEQLEQFVYQFLIKRSERLKKERGAGK